MSPSPPRAPSAPPTAPAHDPRATSQNRTKLNYLRYLHSPEGKAPFRLGISWFSVVIAAILFVSIVAIPAGIGHVIGMMIRQSLRKKKFDAAVAVAKSCEFIYAYPIMANTRLINFQNQRAPGLVMGSFRDDLGVEYFANLAVILRSISHAPPDGLPPVEAALRQALTDEKYVENRRRRIPDEFTGGVPVYLFDLMIDGSRLMGGRLDSIRIPCLAGPGDRGVIFNIPFHTVDADSARAIQPLSAPARTDEPIISDECFALVSSASAPVGPGHPIHAVVDDVALPCPRCQAPLVSLLTLRLDAPELHSFASRLPAPGLQTVRIIVCERCCIECLHIHATLGPTGEPIAASIRIHDDVYNKDFPPSPALPSFSPGDKQRRWTRDALRLDPTSHPRTAAIDYAFSSGDHLGGLPRWIQDPEPPACPACRRTMPFLAHINEFELGEGDVDLFAFWCPGCSTTAVVPQQS